MAEMPFADERCCVVGLQRFSDGDLGQRQAVLVVGLDDRIAKAGADGVAAGHQPGARGRADVGGGVKGRELRAFLRHAIEIGRADQFRAVGAEIAIAQIVGEDDDDVGLAARRLGQRLRRRRGEGRCCRSGLQEFTPSCLLHVLRPVRVSSMKSVGRSANARQIDLTAPSTVVSSPV